MLSFSRTRNLSAEHLNTLAYTRPFRIPVAIGELQVEAQLDTGANVALVMPQAHYDAISNAAVVTPDRLTLANGNVDGARARLREPLRMGAQTLSGIEVRVSTRFPEVLIGAHALQGSVVLIDQRSQRIAICAAPSVSP